MATTGTGHTIHKTYQDATNNTPNGTQYVIVEIPAGFIIVDLTDFKPAPGTTRAVEFPNREIARKAARALDARGYIVRQWNATQYTIVAPTA